MSKKLTENKDKDIQKPAKTMLENNQQPKIVEEIAESKLSPLENLKSYAGRFRLAFQAINQQSPNFIVILIINAIVQSAQIGLAVFIPKVFLDVLMRQLAWSSAVYLILGIALLEGILKLAQNTLKRKIEVEQVRVQHGIEREISTKVTRLPYHYLEDTEILNLKESAHFALLNQQVAVYIITNLQEILRYGLTIILLLTILAQLSIILVLFLFGTFVIIALLQNSLKTYETNFFLNIIGINRKYGYFIEKATQPELQQAIRIYNLDPLLSTRVDQLNLEILDFMQEYMIHSGKIQGIQAIITDLQAVVAYGYSAMRVLTNVVGSPIGIGSFSLYAGTTIQFSIAMRKIFDAYRDIKQSLDYLEPYQKFMQLPEIGQSSELQNLEVKSKQGSGSVQVSAQVSAHTSIQDSEQASTRSSDQTAAQKLFADQNMQTNKCTPIEEIVFDRVTFTYPNSKEPVLKDISFTIHQGEKISIVGLNGAGKTTLVKLLCRFFEPDSGRILINGEDIQTLDEASYLREVSAVFQDFRLLPFSIQSNIASLPDQMINQDQQLISKIETIVSETSVNEFAQNFKNGIKTKLNKSIHKQGTELSGGQSQKVAIARALYKEGSLVILDEPTSALDPLAEAEIYEHFDTLVQGQTALYISHRMSSSKFCDKVLVLEQGRVAGFAPHQVLIKDKNSLYTRLFNEQAKYYEL